MLLVTTGALAAPKSTAPPALFDEIAKADQALFGAFNAHDADKLAARFSDDLEFYHDKDGLQRKAATMASFRTIFARNDGLHRELVPDTLEVHPLGDYGALEIGAHRFCHLENGKDDCGTFKFVMVWKKTNGQWQVTRVISYDH
jgi:ketosteroid isomerase-like protein